MNWIEIDRILYSIIKRHDKDEDIIKESMKQFKWDRRQAETAVKPLLKRHDNLQNTHETQKTRSKRVTKSKK